MSGPVTTEALIRAYADKTGIAEAECLQIVAKSASIRAMARKYGRRFVLKGGTLLYHVYKTRRASYKDADLAEKGGHYEDPDELGRVLTITEGAFKLREDAGRWGWGQDLIEGLEIPVDLGIKVDLPRYKRLKITVSLRQSEQLDPPIAPLLYTDEMLADESTFEVNGLTLNELAAEKIIGWTLRGEPKHYADLGLIGRDHAGQIDAGKVEDFIRRKVAGERQMAATRGFYAAKRVRGPADLAKRFHSPALAGRPRSLGRRRDTCSAFCATRRTRIARKGVSGHLPHFSYCEPPSILRSQELECGITCENANGSDDWPNV